MEAKVPVIISTKDGPVSFVATKQFSSAAEKKKEMAKIARKFKSLPAANQAEIALSMHQEKIRSATKAGKKIKAANAKKQQVLTRMKRSLAAKRKKNASPTSPFDMTALRRAIASKARAKRRLIF